MKRVALTAAMLLLALGASAAVLAQGPDYELPWSRVAAGGATFSTGGAYELGGTIGQGEAGTVTGGTYALTGGLWGGVIGLAGQTRIFLPLAIKQAAP